MKFDQDQLSRLEDHIRRNNGGVPLCLPPLCLIGLMPAQVLDILNQIIYIGLNTDSDRLQDSAARIRRQPIERYRVAAKYVYEVAEALRPGLGNLCISLFSDVPPEILRPDALVTAD